MFRNMFKGAGLALIGVLCAAAAEAEVLGAGASLPAPAIEAWAKKFAQESKIEIDYESVGSGEGIRRVTAHGADFAMTDVPLTQAELAQDDLLQFPIVAGAIVPVLNLPGVASGQIKLSGALLADIFLGKLASWDAAPIRAANPGMNLPSLPIRVVHRADGSGSSFVFTHYLSQVSPEWQERLGIGSRLRWPAGEGAVGSDGVIAAVRGTPGAIGYVEYAYALKDRLATAQLANKAGKFVQPTLDGVRAALATIAWSRPSYYEVLTDRDGAGSWPIVGISFALLHKKQANAGDARETLDFIDWIYRHGGSQAGELDYVGIEDAALVARIESAWKQIRDENGQIVWKGGAAQ